MERPLTVVLIATARTWRGGEAQLFALTEGLLKRGHNAIIAARPDSALTERARAAGFETDALRTGPALNPMAIGRVAKILRRREADIAHMHDSHAQVVGVLGSQLARRGRRVVSRRVDFHRTGLSVLKYKFGVHRYLAVSNAVRNVLIEDGVAPKRVSVVFDGVDPEARAHGDGARVRRDLGLSDDTPLVGTVAHFAGHKALEMLIRAAPGIVEAVPDARILLLGDGDLREELERERAASPVKDHILMPGFFENVGDFLAAFDVFVMPSRMEGLCSSILDAFAARVPVAATRAGGIPELIEHEVTGLLCEPEQPEALAGIVVRLLQDADLGRRTVEAAHKALCARFTHDAMVEGTLQVYREVLGIS